MESVKEPRLISLGNSDAPVTDGANNVCGGATELELHRPSGLRILYRVGEQIRENVPQQALVGLHLGGHFSDQEFDWTSPLSCGQNFVHQPPNEGPQL